MSFRFATCLRWRLDDATLIVVSTAFIIRNDGWVLRRVASINHHVDQGEQGGHGEGGEAGEVGGVQGESLAHQVAGLCSQVSALSGIKQFDNFAKKIFYLFKGWWS